MPGTTGTPRRRTIPLIGRIDLHTHTTASDGTLAPEVLFQRALDHNIQILSITDHDTTEGYSRVAPLAAAQPSFRLIPGIEMSAEGPFHCHLLGYGIGVEDIRFQDHLSRFRRLRLERIEAMVQRLQVLGLPITLEKVREKAGGSSLGRPHIADALIELKVVKKRQEAFDRFLKRDGPAFVESITPTPQETLGIIREAGGIPVLAHPAYDTSEELLKRLVDWGLMGIEAYYPEHSKGLIDRYRDLAKRYNLVTTGGSDYHGPRTGRRRLACVHVPEEVVEMLDRRLRGES